MQIFFFFWQKDCLKTLKNMQILNRSQTRTAKISKFSFSDLELLLCDCRYLIPVKLDLFEGAVIDHKKGCCISESVFFVAKQQSLSM